MFRVLTVASECGSGGSMVAQKVAEELGWSLLDRALIGAVAQTARVDAKTVARYDEHVDSWWHRFHRGGLWCAAIEGGLAPRDVQFFDADAIAAFSQRVIAKAAARGNCVIVGRGAQCVLRGHEDVLHIFVYGPWSERVARVRRRTTSNDAAGQWIRLTDSERARYLRTYYRCDWKDPHLYHMMISSRIGIDQAAGMIVDAVHEGTRQLV